MRGGGKRVARWAAALGFVVLAMAGYALKDWVRDEYLLWRLERGDESTLDSLSPTGGLRAFPICLERAEGQRDAPFGNAYLAYLFWTAAAWPDEAVPVLLAQSKNANPTVRMHSAVLLSVPLQERVRLAGQVVSRLQEMVSEDPDGRVRQASAEALKKIKGEKP